MLRGMVESTAGHVFGQAIAEGFELTLAESGSYSSWLRAQVVDPESYKEATPSAVPIRRRSLPSSAGSTLPGYPR